MRLRYPAFEEPIARCEEMPAVIGGKLGKRHLRERSDFGSERCCAPREEAIAGAAMRLAITEARIFRGHGFHAVEAGIAVANIVEARFGERKTIALSAISRVDDIETAEGEMLVIDGH